MAKNCTNLQLFIWFQVFLTVSKCFSCYSIHGIVKPYVYVAINFFEYSKVPNKRSATFINLRKIFQGLRSYLEGVRLLVLTKYFLQVRKVGFKIPNSMKIILFEEGVRLFEGGMLIVSTQISRGYVYLGGYAYQELQSTYITT